MVAVARCWSVYVLECAGNKLYTGISPDPAARFAQHVAGAGAKYTKANKPLRILAAREYPSRSAASVAEYQLKKMRRPQKLLWVEAHVWKAASAQA